MSGEQRRRGPSTVGVHGGRPAVASEPVVAPLVQSSTFVFKGSDPDEVLRYSRWGNNPNQLAVGRKVAELEGTESAAPLSSGMAATAMALLALTGPGDHVVASQHLYGATRTLIDEEFPTRGIRTTFVDPDTPRAWRAAMRPETRALFLEIPTNPTLRIYDPRPLARLAHELGTTLLVDATFASPVNLRPTELGADVVIHSASKYLGGHSDLIAGVVAGPREVVDAVVRMMTLYGSSLDPHAAWLLDRGLRTLDVRVRRQNENALALATWLERRSEVASVLYPGLPSHPDHAVAQEIFSGFGGMVSFVLADGGPAADRFLDGIRLAVAAPSLGSVETLVSQPRYTSHLGWSAEQRIAAGIPDGFVRVSVGVEDVEDLIADFERALEEAHSASMNG